MVKKSQLGIYFSYNFINIVEQQDKKVVNFAKIPCIFEEAKFDLGKIVMDEVKIVNLIKEELSRNNIPGRDAVLGLLSRDLIIRFFEVPMVPRTELEATVGFESRKYIPFKLEELIFDFQHSVDRKSKKIRVLFIAIRRDLLDKYVSILEQAGLNIKAIEPVFISTLRLLKSTKNIDVKNPVAIVEADFDAEYGDITVIEDLYPRFSRDLNLKIQSEKETVPKEDMLFKLVNEIRISLDYCRRQFSSDPINISKVILLSNEFMVGSVETLSKELDMPIISVNIREEMASICANLDLELAKSYGLSLRDSVSFPLKIDLFIKFKSLTVIKEEFEEDALKKVISQVDKTFLIKNVLVSLAMIFAVYFLSVMQVKIHENKLGEMKKKRSALNFVPDIQSVTYQSLKEVEGDYSNKIFALNNLARNKIYFTDKFSALAILRKKGIWITGISFKDSDTKQELAFQGLVYLGGEKEEFDVANNFLSELKKNKAFSNFKKISMGSFSRGALGEYLASNFDVYCE
ncbi:MAG: pilus assembly protein PilM [Candidatus Omnitrophota bacterium]|nr:pilus assembly protein PilM [Candidatus Omnitrophota bacterium]